MAEKKLVPKNGEGARKMPSLKIFRRSKNIDSGIGRNAVELTFESLEKHFSMPIAKAALQLEVCATSLKWYAISHKSAIFIFELVLKRILTYAT